MDMKSICIFTDNPGIANLLTNNGVYVDKTNVLLKLLTCVKAGMTLGFALTAGMGFAETDGGLRVEARTEAGGPRLCVNGKAVLPRFLYGSPTCLCNIAGTRKTTLKVPFAAAEDSANGRVAFTGYYGIAPIWWSDAKLVDLTAGVTNVVLEADREIHAKDYVADGLRLKSGHRYHFVITHRASRPRTYFHVNVSAAKPSGERVAIPYYYGDTLGDTVRMAGRLGGVNLVTFSTDSSWGCEDWWQPPEEPEEYSKLDRECARLVAINPNVLLVPRLTVDAPVWMLKRHPEIKMSYDTGIDIGISSVASRLYRQAACAAVEKVARHLKRTFPRHFAGLQLSGQNSAEWFYMISTGEHLSGYDVSTRDAFRAWLKERGCADWATAEVPTSQERHRRDKDERLLAFSRFRQEDMASFLLELASAAKRGSNGEALTLFFYGYSWEIGGACGGAAETGHFAFDWLLQRAHGKIDGFSSPLSYKTRNLTGSTAMMSAAETVLRNGYLWMNEIDHRTHHEEMWDHMALFTPYTDPAVTREIFLRDSAAGILRGYGDWWMDLFGRGWLRDERLWKLRAELVPLDRAMLARRKTYSPMIANVVDEESFLHDGWRAGRAKVLDRRGFATCGADYGQYLLPDFLRHPPESVKLCYLTVADHLTPDAKARLNEVKKARPDLIFVENVTAADLTAEAISVQARRAGVHLFTAPGKANVCSAEGYVVVQALQEGPLEIDFGTACRVVDMLTGEPVGHGPVVTRRFAKGECHVYRLLEAAEAPRQ